MKLIIPAAVLTALTLAAAPALAQAHERGNQGRSGNDGQRQGQAVQRPHAQAPQPQRAQPQRAQPAPQRAQPPRAAEQPRRAEQPREQARPEENRGQRDRFESRGRFENHGQYDPRVGRAVPRGNVIVRPRVERPIVVSPRYYGPHGYYSAPYYGYRPYTFRPRTHIAFGIYLGYPVPYTYAYPYPVPVYGYGSPVAPVIVGPNSSIYGGVSLEITPNNAEVYVDGEYAGLVQDFDGTQEPLTLTPGQHRLEIRADGYEPLVLDVNVNPGEVLPYRGDLHRF